MLGDVYRIPHASLRALDRYEECDPLDPTRADRGLFRRDRVVVRMSDGRRLTAWAYFYNGRIREGRRLQPSTPADGRRLARARRFVVD